MKLIAIIEVPDNFKGGYADCKIFEDRFLHRTWNRIVKLKPLPKKKGKVTLTERTQDIDMLK